MTSDTEPTVDEIAPGNWGVFKGDELVQGGFATQAAAWAYVDRKRVRPLWKNAKNDWWGR